MEIKANPTALSGWKRTLLTLCSLLVLISIPAAAAALTAEYVLFAPATYLDVFKRSGFYQEYPHLMLDFAASGGDLFAPGMGGMILKFLQEKKGDAVLRFIFPEDWARGQVVTLTDQFWDYYNFTSPHLDLELDLSQVKQRLTSGEGADWIGGLVSAWPDCSASDVLAITAAMIQGKTDSLPACKPPALLEKPFLGAVQLGWSAVSNSLPERVRLLPLQTGSPGGLYHTLRYGLRFAPVGLLMIFLVALGLLGGSWRLAAGWAVLPLYMGGLVTALGAVLIYILGGWALPMPAQLFPAPAAEIYSFVRLVFFLVAERFLAWTALAGLAAAGFGLVLRWTMGSGQLSAVSGQPEEE